MKPDAHARPPESLRILFKKWQKCSTQQIENSSEILDARKRSSDVRLRRLSRSVEQTQLLSQIFEQFVEHADPDVFQPPQFFEVRSLPGLVLVPTLLPCSVQETLLNKLLHRDLGHPDHKTNLDLHYDVNEQISGYLQQEVSVPLPSLFDLDPGLQLIPQDPHMHRSITIRQALEKKLRWVTLGGQYDWTQKEYPEDRPPQFPQDIADLVRGAFPEIEPQAAILNFYSPGDTLSVHRDVSEECERGLISLSIGCDALFMVASADGEDSAVIRLRSGDAVLMSGQSRYAWHAVPKVLAGTCNPELQDWPAGRGKLQNESQWRGWMANKRVNLNIRQMQNDPFECSDRCGKKDVSSIT